MKSQKQLFIKAYMYFYGVSKEKAEKAYKRATAEYIAAIIAGFLKNARHCFYTD